jgi:hypothetical protein
MKKEIDMKLPFKEVKGFIRSDEYLNFLRIVMPCCVCSKAPESHAHHTETGGKGIKCDDTKCIPLCTDCHNEIHTKGKETFYKKHNLHIENLMFRLLNTFIKWYIDKCKIDAMYKKGGSIEKQM